MTRTFKPVRVKCAWTLMFIAACLVVAQDSVLHIKVVTGDGAQHSPGAHAKPLTVEVTDATGRPVAGARVSFQVPGEGPGGVFANGLRTEVAITDSSGHATAHGLQLNHTEGPFAIRITAAKEQARAGTIARQSIGNTQGQIESADRKAPTPAATQPEPAPPAAPQRPAQPPPAISVPGTTATGPVKVAAAQQPPPPAQSVKTAEELPQGVPTIIVTQKSSKSISEIGADGGHKSHKWLWIALIAAGGGGTAFAASSLKRAAAAHSTSSTAVAGGLSIGVTIGTPTITIGQP